MAITINSVPHVQITPGRFQPTNQVFGEPGSSLTVTAGRTQPDGRTTASLKYSRDMNVTASNGRTVTRNLKITVAISTQAGFTTADMAGVASSLTSLLTNTAMNSLLSGSPTLGQQIGI